MRSLEAAAGGAASESARAASAANFALRIGPSGSSEVSLYSIHGLLRSPSAGCKVNRLSAWALCLTRSLMDPYMGAFAGHRRYGRLAQRESTAFTRHARPSVSIDASRG